MLVNLLCFAGGVVSTLVVVLYIFMTAEPEKSGPEWRREFREKLQNRTRL